MISACPFNSPGLRSQQHQQRTLVVRPHARQALGGNGAQRGRRNGAAGEREVIEGNGRGAGMRGHQRMQPAIVIEQQRGTGKFAQIAALDGALKSRSASANWLRFLSFSPASGDTSTSVSPKRCAGSQPADCNAPIARRRTPSVSPSRMNAC